MVSGVSDPYIEVAEVSPDGGVNDGRGPVGIGIIPITVEDHQPGALALDAVERRARRLGERPRRYRQLNDRGSRPAEADDHVAGLCLLLSSSLEEGAQPKRGREESEKHHSQHNPPSKRHDLP